jgi:hypothetical protein
VRKSAVGEDGGGWGINNANAKNTKSLFRRIGINPFPEEKADELDALVALRGEITHTARTKESIYKAEVAQWQELVASLCEEVDSEARQQCQNWLVE